MSSNGFSFTTQVHTRFKSYSGLDYYSKICYRNYLLGLIFLIKYETIFQNIFQQCQIDLPISSHKQSSHIVIVTKVNRHYRHHRHDRHIKIPKKYLNALLSINRAKKLFANHFIIPYYTGNVQNMLKKCQNFHFLNLSTWKTALFFVSKIVNRHNHDRYISSSSQKFCDDVTSS